MSFGCSLKQAWGEDFGAPQAPKPREQPGYKNKAYELPHPAPERPVIMAPPPPPPAAGFADPGVQKTILYLASGAFLIVFMDIIVRAKTK